MRGALRRLALVPPTLLGITLCTFLLLHLAPGDPASVRLGQSRGVSPEALLAYRQAFGLDPPASPATQASPASQTTPATGEHAERRSLVSRYVAWLGRSLRLDFGISLTDGRPVRDKLAEALPATAALALLAAALSYLIAVPLGGLLALSDGRPGERVAAALLHALYALPTAALGLGLLALGAPYGRGLGPLVAAAGCLALPMVVRLSRHQRGALVSTLRADFARTARALGASEARVLFRHALRHALLPMVTLLSGELPALLSGSVIVEQLFGVRGLGLLGIDAVLGRDYPLVLGLTTLGALFTLAGVLGADVAYGLLDPRLRRQGA